MNKAFLEPSNFDAMRYWFNKNFKLSLNGKFAGIKRVKNLYCFLYRLYKKLSCRYYRKPLLDDTIMTFRLSGQTIKLYSI